MEIIGNTNTKRLEEFSMSKNIKEIMNEVFELNQKIKQLLSHAEYEQYDDLSGLKYDDKNPDDLMMLDELKTLFSKMDDISYTINYLSRPIKEEGFLHKNRNGRYEINGHEFSSGSGIECLISDEWHFIYDKNGKYVETPYWYASRIEHDGKDYYIVGVHGVELEGLRVRIR